MSGENFKNQRTGSLYLIDAPGFVFRAYHALPPLTTAQGIPTGAVYGFTNMLLRLISDHRPDYVAAVFDVGKSFRHDLYDDYKANRPPTPPDLLAQFSLVHEVLDAFHIARLQMEGYEADDIIATLARRASAEGLQVTIVSSDKDLMQLAGDGIQLLDTMKGDKVVGPEAVVEKYGITPEQLGDWLALVGDSSDNVPGVPGVGPKTATKLLQAWGDLDGVLNAGDAVSGKKLKSTLAESAEQVRLSRKLVELCTDCPLPMQLDDLRRTESDRDALRALFERCEFGRLLKKLDDVTATRSSMLQQPEQASAPQSEQTSREASCAIVDTVSALDDVVTQLRKGTHCCAVPLTVNRRNSDLVGLALCWDAHAACYIPIAHSYLGVAAQLSREQVGSRLATVLGDEGVTWVCHDYKALIKALHSIDVSAAQVQTDAMLASYVCDPARSRHTVEELALEHLGQQIAPLGKREIQAAQEITIEDARDAMTTRATAVWQVASKLRAALQNDSDLQTLFDEVEMPLSRVLAQMELRGCLVNINKLRALSAEIDAQLVRTEQSIHAQAGWAVNLNSPKQLQQLLFDQLSLTTGRKTKTGYSTDAEVLSELALQHPIAAEIHNYRVLSKLKSTYLDALPALVDSKTGRVHTSYNQAVAATGRLSSSDPNLQNIPIRTDMGRRIREAFEAPDGYLLVSADYSQIELRILAHLCGDPVLIDAFRQGQDVHTRTAAEVFGVAPENVTDEQRRVAKAVNFGVIYGQTDWGLARQLRIPKAEAGRYIDGYFARYADVQRFMNETIADAHRDRVVRTLLGRKRFVADLDSKRHGARTAAERIVRNTPIQGTAADLLKVAMIDVDRALKEAKVDAPMILTVHDELVIEARETGAEQVAQIVCDAMTNVMELRVPLKVDVAIGKTWSEAH